MIRTFLSTSVLLASSLLVGQGTVVVQVLTPSSIAGPVGHVFMPIASTEDPISTWGVPDMTDPANAVTGELALGRDGSAADTLGCDPLVNGSEVAGKIAVFYRGVCPFSQKAINAQNAGAIAVLVIFDSDTVENRRPGAGPDGPNITIPVALISETGGMAIRPVMDVEPVTAFLGNNFQAFPNNIHFGVFDVLVPSALSVPTAIAVDASEYQVPLGAFIHNWGSELISTARLRATVMQGATEVYSEVSDNQTLFPGDSLFVELPTFTQPSYSGTYSIDYTLESDVEDNYTLDNTFDVPLSFGTVMSYVPVDENGLPTANNYYAPNPREGAFRTCIQFADTNASRLVVPGLYFSATTYTDQADPVDTTLTNLLVVVQAYLWNQVVTSPFAFPEDGSLTTLTNGDYSYPSNLQEEVIYIPFEEPVELDNNQRYLFCVQTSDPLVFHGWNEDVDYQTNAQFFTEPTSIIQNNTTWFNGFVNTPGGPCMAIKTVDENTIGIAENANKVDITPYPNPTNDFLNIPMKGFSGAATLQIFDISGAKVAEQKVAVGGNNLLNVDVKGISAGTYMFHMEFENGKRSDFRVVVAK